MVRKHFFINLSCVCALAFANAALSQTINLSLNLHYNNVFNPAFGGTWNLVAKTDAPHGIAGLDVVLTNINLGGITYQSGINAMTIGGNAMVISGPSFVQILYGQDSTIPANVVLDVGRGVGTPGNVPLDFINDPTWNNAARIMTGTFAAATPAFTVNNDTPADGTDGNVWSTSTAPFHFASAATITTTVRNNFNSILGDYNRNGVVDAADYPIWRDTLNKAGQGLAADGSFNSLIDQNDYAVWRNRFGATSGSGASAGDSTAVPEPGSVVILTMLLAIGAALTSTRRVKQISAGVLIVLFLCNVANAAQRTWIGGNVNWIETAGIDPNWSPNVFLNEPDSGDEAIFNTANAVNLGSNNSIQALTMSGGIDLFTNDFDLTVDGLVQLSGASTNLWINGSAGSVNADDVVINSGAIVELRGGLLTMDEEAGTALIDINSGGVLQGNGNIDFADNPGVATLMLVNDGTITALSRGLTVFSPPPVGTLHLGDIGVNGRLDLDGSSETGVVNVNRNQTFFTEMQLFDTFNGTLNLFHNSTFKFNPQFTLGTGGSIVVDNGFVAGGLGFSDILADTSYIDSAQLTQTGGTINVVDSDGTLQIDAPFTMSGGSFTNFGTVIFNGVTEITAPSGYVPSSLNSQTIVNANVTINHPGSNFNWDGNGSSDTTINGTALLSITANQIDTPLGDNTFGGTITLNDSGDLTVNNSLGEWQMAGSLIKNGTGVSTISGATLGLTGSGQVNAGTLDVNSSSIFTDSTNLVVASGATATLSTTRSDVGATYTANGTLSFGALTITGTPDPIGGTGVLRFNSTSVIEASTTINTATFDWDGAGIGSLHTINPGVTFTINSGVLDSDGDMDDPFSLAGNGSQLIVNSTNGLTQWTARGTITANAAAAGTATIGGTSRMILSGGAAILNVDGNTTASAPVTFGAGSTTAIDLTKTLRLTGGNTTNNVNRIEGGTINGPGLLAADTGKELRGFGTINSNIDFDGASNLFADDGTLTINGSILDVNRIGTDDVDGILNVVNAWNTSVTSFLQMNGGTIQGGTMTIDNVNSLSGFGTVSSRVINNTGIRASGGTLVLQTAGNDNDWDGAANNASLHAQSNSTLELRDNATFGFTGAVSMFSGGKVFTNGFALDFNPGSSLFLNSNATYESTSSTDLGGVVTTSAGPASTIKVQNNFFLTFEPTSTTTLVADLRLENNNINIEDGATFSGTGALIIPDGSHLVADNLADIGVLLDMQGTFRPGNFDGIGRVNLFDYQQEDTGELFVELTGTALNAFDRLVASGDVVLDGYLNIDIDGGFVPALGNTFNIITGNTVTGTFDTVDVSGVPAGLAFQVNYLLNAVQLQVVNKPNFAADFDDDGDVDKTDLAIWKGAFNLNQLGDADGDNDSDGADFLIWQRQFGSKPGLGAGSGLDANIPEPSSIAILLIGLVAIGARWFPFNPL